MEVKNLRFDKGKDRINSLEFIQRFPHGAKDGKELGLGKGQHAPIE